MKRVHIIGRKNHGKTTLVAELVRELRKRGFRVGTIKHTHHHHELDTPGKDSHVHAESGSDVVGIKTPTKSAAFWSPHKDDQQAMKYVDFEPLFSTCDVVLVEGDSQAEAPKLEVWRASVGSRPLAEADTTVAALVTDDTKGLPPNVPLLPRANVPQVADKILSLL